MDRRYKKFAAYLPFLVALPMGAWLSSRLLSAWPIADHSDSTSPQVALRCTERDLGTVCQGTVLRATFRITNAGTRRLILREEGAGCCGQSTRPPEIILPPGGSKDLTLDVDTAPWHGRMQQTVRYVTNDPRRPRFALQVNATVESPPSL